MNHKCLTAIIMCITLGRVLVSAQNDVVEDETTKFRFELSLELLMPNSLTKYMSTFKPVGDKEKFPDFRAKGPFTYGIGVNFLNDEHFVFSLKHYRNNLATSWSQRYPLFPNTADSSTKLIHEGFRTRGTQTGVLLLRRIGLSNSLEFTFGFGIMYYTYRSKWFGDAQLSDKLSIRDFRQVKANFEAQARYCFIKRGVVGPVLRIEFPSFWVSAGLHVGYKI